MTRGAPRERPASDAGALAFGQPLIDERFLRGAPGIEGLADQLQLRLGLPVVAGLRVVGRFNIPIFVVRLHFRFTPITNVHFLVQPFCVRFGMFDYMADQGRCLSTNVRACLSMNQRTSALSR